MSALLKLKKTIGRSYDNDPDDTLEVKHALERLGYYQTPDYSMTPYTDDEMFRAVEEFQQDFDLKVDGVVRPDNQTATRIGEVLAYEDPARELGVPEQDPGNTPRHESSPRNSEKPSQETVANAVAIPAIVMMLAAASGMTVLEAFRWWRSLPPEQRRALRDKLLMKQSGDKAGSEEDEQERERTCDEMHEIDTRTCKAVAKHRGARAGERCHATATSRLAACRRGKPLNELPPLDTWDQGF